MCFACLYVSAAHAFIAIGGQKSASDLELELLVAVDYHARNWTPVQLEEQQVFLTAKLSLQPLNIRLLRQHRCNFEPFYAVLAPEFKWKLKVTGGGA